MLLKRLQFEKGSYLEAFDEHERLGMSVHDSDAKVEVGYHVTYLMEWCGIEDTDVVENAPRVLAQMIADKVIEADENVGAVGSLGSFRAFIRGERHPGIQMLRVWLRTIKYFWSQPEIQADVYKYTGLYLPDWSHVRNLECKIYYMCGHCPPDVQVDAWSSAVYDRQSRTDVRFKRVEKRKKTDSLPGITNMSPTTEPNLRLRPPNDPDQWGVDPTDFTQNGNIILYRPSEKQQ